MYLNSDDSFDDNFENSNYIKYFPFIGEGYFETSPKILVLGESQHWNKNEINIEDTRINLIEYGEAIRDNKTTPNTANAKSFRNTAAMIKSKDYYNADDVWYNLAFYNFFQGLVGKKAGDKSLITKELIQQSQKAYFDVIKILKPDLIIAWGVSKLFSEWVPQNNKQMVSADFPDTYIWHIQHPSKYFSCEFWQKEYLIIKEKYFNSKVGY